jgi:hypothetical protein
MPFRGRGGTANGGRSPVKAGASVQGGRPSHAWMKPGTAETCGKSGSRSNVFHVGGWLKPLTSAKLRRMYPRRLGVREPGAV